MQNSASQGSVKWFVYPLVALTFWVIGTKTPAAWISEPTLSKKPEVSLENQIWNIQRRINILTEIQSNVSPQSKDELQPAILKARAIEQLLTHELARQELRDLIVVGQEINSKK